MSCKVSSQFGGNIKRKKCPVKEQVFISFFTLVKTGIAQCKNIPITCNVSAALKILGKRTKVLPAKYVYSIKSTHCSAKLPLILYRIVYMYKHFNFVAG